MPRPPRDNEFEVTFHADDGYVGGSRPKHFRISEDDFESDSSEIELRALFTELLEDAFREQVHAASNDEDKFLEWAKQRQEAMKTQEEAEG